MHKLRTKQPLVEARNVVIFSLIILSCIFRYLNKRWTPVKILVATNPPYLQKLSSSERNQDHSNFKAENYGFKNLALWKKFPRKNLTFFIRRWYRNNWCPPKNLSFPRIDVSKVSILFYRVQDKPVVGPSWKYEQMRPSRYFSISS